MPQLRPKAWHWLILASAVAVFVGAKFLLLPYYEPTAQPVAVSHDAPCHLQKGCLLPNGSTVRFIGKPSTKIPFSIEINDVHSDVEPVYVSFSMVDMDMGFNRYKLIPITPNAKRRIAKNIRLPVCIVQRTDYLMDITIGKDQYSLPFRAR